MEYEGEMLQELYIKAGVQSTASQQTPARVMHITSRQGYSTSFLNLALQV